MFSLRLKQLRLARGLSLDELAAEMGGIVSKQALSKYELGTAHPSPVVLNKLAAALRVKAAHLMSEPAIAVNFIAYRRRSGLPKREQEKVQSLVVHTLEERLRLLFLSEPTELEPLPVERWKVDKMEETETAAMALREQWKLGLDPIGSLVGVLEDHAVQVLEIDADQRFDGISAVATDQTGQQISAAVVTRRGVPGERQRLNLAHELGHLVLKIGENVNEEKAAFRFGAAFLAPAEAIQREIGRQRTMVQPAELLLLKQRFGLSMQSLLYRLCDLHIITESHFKQWFIDINRLGWRLNEPGELSPEQPQWVRQQVLRLLAEGLLTKEEAEAISGEALETSLPLSLIERQAFLKLPLAERRRKMAAQADKMVAVYIEDKERDEWQGGDFIDY